MKDPLVSRVGEYIRKHEMIKAGEHVLAAVSGGADSVFLLCALGLLQQEAEFSLSVAHVEHGIRGESSRKDALFVEALCEKRGIPCHVVSVDAPAYAKENQTGLEEAARQLRYQALEETASAEKCGRIAVAHHMEDNAETMLFHLARGTGLAGLSGIPPVRGRIIRPLLDLSRNEIEEWLLEKGETWRTDETNQDVSYSRNRIRAEVLPQLTEINPLAVRHMTDTADLLRRTVRYLDQEADRILSGCRRLEEDGSMFLQLPVLQSVDPVLKEHVVYRALQQAAGSARDITGEHVRSVAALCEKEVGKLIVLPDGLSAEKEYDQIRIGKRAESFTDREEADESLRAADLTIPGETVFGDGVVIRADLIAFDGDMKKIPRKTYTKWFDYDKIEHSLQIRPRKPGDYLQISQKGGRKSIQDYMVEEKIPAKQRGRIPLIADGDHILWVIGGRISEAYKVTEQTKRILVLDRSDET